MTLAEMSKEYHQSARQLRTRLRELRQMLPTAAPQYRAVLRHRIYMLTVMQHQMYELEHLTAHYYERGFYRDRKYTL